MSADRAKASAIIVDDALLHAWPLPAPDANGDKEDRGRTVVIAGSREMPGAGWLAAVGALRAGAGKLVVVTAQSVSSGLALKLPEARVIGLGETAQGGLVVDSRGLLTDVLERADAVLIGPGLQDVAASVRLVGEVIACLAERNDVQLVLDAAAINGATGRFALPVLLTPHAGEMASLSGIDKHTVNRNSELLALETAQKYNAVVALKGATTWVAAPDGQIWRHDGGNVGLATAGSGDTLAGITCGLAARRASLEQAAVWGVALHARAGEVLARRVGPLGYLASELPFEVPALMRDLAKSVTSQGGLQGSVDPLFKTTLRSRSQAGQMNAGTT
jgi:ADP-dependent NAD(P)H-hydrate dehydratase